MAIKTRKAYTLKIGDKIVVQDWEGKSHTHEVFDVDGDRGETRVVVHLTTRAFDTETFYFADDKDIQVKN